MALTANSFSKCAPSISTNIKQCGTVALCNAQPLTTDDLTDVYMKSDEYRVMEHLLHADMEIKMCGATQNGLYDFLMANKVNLSKRVVPTDRAASSGLMRIAPFIKARQLSPINNEYWLFSDGASAGGGHWSVVVTSSADIPFDVRSFPEGLRVFLKGQSEGGSAIRTAYAVVSVTDNNDNSGTLVLASLNANSSLDTDKLGNPVAGYMTRGSNNVDDFEKECNESPAYLNNKLVPFWIQTTRWSFCKSSKYDEYRSLSLENNALYREFGDLDETQRNQQIANDFQKRWVQNVFWAKKLPHQSLADYDQLETIESADISEDLGVDGGVCIGKRAEAEGIYEQMAECGRVVDLLGDKLNLNALFKSFYNIIRVRSTQGNNNKVIDVFTDTITAELISRAMIKYYSVRSTDHNGDSTLRMTMPAEGYQVAKKADFGFTYRSFPLFWPAGVTMNILTHWSFDDELAVAKSKDIENTARILWVLDFAGIYPGIIATNRVVAKTGDLKTLSSINADFACVMRVHTRQQTLNSVTYTVVVECPQGNLIIENFACDAGTNLPSVDEVEGLEYPTTSTTTTAP